jgi:hypothetical protein
MGGEETSSRSSGSQRKAPTQRDPAPSTTPEITGSDRFLIDLARLLGRAAAAQALKKSQEG